MKERRAVSGDWAPYLAGVGVVYLGCFLAGSGFSTVVGEKIVNGFFWGTLISVIFVPINFLIQFLTRFVIRKLFQLRNKAENLLLCSPAAAFVLCTLSATILSRPAEGIFKEDIADPIPPSVKIVDYGYSMSIASGTYGSLRFEIGQDDLHKILKEKGYELTDYDFGRTSQLIERRTALKVVLQLPYEHYVSMGNRREWHIIFNTNSSTVYSLAYPGGRPPAILTLDPHSPLRLREWHMRPTET
jgi:hypothetical protein